MQITQSLLALIIFFIPAVSMASDTTIEEGKQLYKASCSACHGATGGMDMNKRIAPPIAGVRLHYIGAHPDKTSFINAITNWVVKQDESKSLMRGAIRKFKIMPAITVAKEDAEKIATYIFEGELEKLAGFDEHVQQMHGQNK